MAAAEYRTETLCKQPEELGTSSARERLSWVKTICYLEDS